MTININKKYFIISVICVIVLVSGFIFLSWMKNNEYEKNVKQCQENIHSLYYMSSILSAEIHDTWRDYIFDGKKYVDTTTGKFYSSSGSWDLPVNVDGSNLEYCYDFSEAISQKVYYFKKKKVNNTLDSLYSDTKTLIIEMTPPPTKFEVFHKEFCDFFHVAEAMYDCATSPEGSLQSYTSTINTLSSDFKKQSSNIDIQIGEIDEHKKVALQLNALLRFR